MMAQQAAHESPMAGRETTDNTSPAGESASSSLTPRAECRPPAVLLGSCGSPTEDLVDVVKCMRKNEKPGRGSK